MKIVICASVDLTPQIKEIKEALEKMGHQTEIPFVSQKIIAGEIALADFLAVKAKEGDASFRQAVGEDLIKRYYHRIKDSDAILVVNGDKRGVKNYIGGNVFLEMGFAYTMNKQIFLLNPIPELSYSDEIKAMQPVIINGDLSRISI
ncbi:MAG: hypothetical protein WC453_03045 [Patescibacteria group bacterium]